MEKRQSKLPISGGFGQFSINLRSHATQALRPEHLLSSRADPNLVNLMYQQSLNRSKQQTLKETPNVVDQLWSGNEEEQVSPSGAPLTQPSVEAGKSRPHACTQPTAPPSVFDSSFSDWFTSKLPPGSSSLPSPTGETGSLSHHYLQHAQTILGRQSLPKRHSLRSGNPLRKNYTGRSVSLREIFQVSSDSDQLHNSGKKRGQSRKTQQDDGVYHFHKRLPVSVIIESEPPPRKRGRPPGSRNKNSLLLDEIVVPIERQRVIRSATDEPPLVARKDLIHHARPAVLLGKASILRHRELGGYPGLGIRNLQQNLRRTIEYEELGPCSFWSGASKDVITVAWSPDGRHFVGGASSDMDDLNLRYNRDKNLLWGDLERQNITELDDHHVDRPRTARPDNNTEFDELYNTLDPRIYTTVSSVCFNQDNGQLFTGSYDRTVKIWDMNAQEKPTCLITLSHEGRVELLNVAGANNSQILATAQATTQGALSVFVFDSLDVNSAPIRQSFTSERAERYGFFPTAMAWGAHAGTQGLLLTGFAENKGFGVGREREGDILLWDVRRMLPYTRLMPTAQRVFDVSWHPKFAIMAAATTPGDVISSRFATKSVIRTWSPLHSPSRIMEFECPAVDINEICFHPTLDHYVVAACTNGKAYMWDDRVPDEILQVMPHDKGIEEVDPNQLREEQDTGMRFISWNSDGSMLYTGSSDGFLKQWNPFVSPEDVFVRDVASFDSGVMTGAFSPDHTNLLLGLCKGSVQMLSLAPLYRSNLEESPFSFIPAGQNLPPTETAEDSV